ncbi:MAG: amino acid adenylation domain-containing protein, partial [bacterium]|nr:amino acid adenylation domain-containing protein [bacterium]
MNNIEEKKTSFFDFDRTAEKYPKDSTIHELFEKQVKRTPDSTAIVYEEKHLSYSELNRRANCLAQLLRKKGVMPGSIVTIVVERSLEMIVGILGILKAGGAYLPIEPEFPREHAGFILTDSRARWLLTQECFLERFRDLTVTAINLESPGIYKEENAGEECPVPPESLAYVIYTSGSTGKPKGVMVEHRSVVNILFALFEKYSSSAKDCYLLKTSVIFDVSVVELFGWFPGGGRLSILGRNHHKELGKIPDVIVHSAVTHINFAPAVFNALLEAIDTPDVAKFSTLRYIFLAGEVLSPVLVNKFSRLNSSVKLENLYGPTEGTVYATSYPLSHWNGKGRVPIGKPLQNMEVYILQEGGASPLIDVPGELCIAGDGVARGYLNNPELTDAKFVETPFEKGVRIYKTGDIAQWGPDGNLDFLGRADHQVKIRGIRIELGEIESRLREHDGIKDAVVTANEKNAILNSGSENKFLYAYVVPKRELETSQLRDYLSKILPNYMQPSYFIKLDKMPLTPSGKIDRHRLPVPQFKVGDKYVAPRDDIEELLTAIWAEILGIDKEIIGIDDGFLELGGHSLKAAAIIARIHKTVNIELSMEEILEIPTIRGLAQYIKGAAENRFIPIEKAEKKEYYPLSSAQERLYIMDRMQFGTAYNITAVYRLGAEPRKRALKEAFLQLIRRHESYRTYFITADGQPVRKIHKNVEFSIDYYEMTEDGEQLAGDERQEELPPSVSRYLSSRFVRPFDLSQAPLMRAGVIKAVGGVHFLLVDTHHIVSDGISMEIFQEELPILYHGEKLPPLPISYRDYSEWQNKEKQKDKFKK